MGGKNTCVTHSSKSIFLESAFFQPSAVRGRARRFGFQTDASIRFERGVEYEIMLVPNITNITYGRGVGYAFEEEVFDEEISSISATKIRSELRKKGEL